MVAPVDELERFEIVGHAIATVVEAERDHALRLGIRKRTKKNGVNEAENGGVGADAKRERENHDRGKSGGLREHPDRVFQVLHQRAHFCLRDLR